MHSKNFLRYINDNYKEGLYYCLTDPSFKEFIKSNTTLFTWATQKTNNPAVLKILLSHGIFIDRSHDTIIEKIDSDYHLYKIKKYIKRNNIETLYNYLKIKKNAVKKVLSSNPDFLSWVLERSVNSSLITNLIKYGMKFDHDRDTFLPLIELYLLNGNEENFSYYIKNPSIAYYIKSNKTLFNHAIKTTGNPLMLKILLSHGIFTDNSHENIIKLIDDIYPLYRIKDYIKRNKKNELFTYLELNKEEVKEKLSLDTSLLPWTLQHTKSSSLIDLLIRHGMTFEHDLKALKSLFQIYFKASNYQGISLCLKNPAVSEFIKSDEKFFTWARKQTNDSHLLNIFLINGVFTDDSHDTIIKEIEIKLPLQEYFCSLDDKNLIEFLKKEDVKKYISSEKKLFPWAIKKTKDPFTLKHLVDHGVNLDYEASSDTVNVFQLIAKKQYLHHYDLLFALIARSIYEKTVNDDIDVLSKILEEKYEKTIPPFKSPLSCTLFEITRKKQNSLQQEFVKKHNAEDSCHPKFTIDWAIKNFLQKKYEENLSNFPKKAQEYLKHLNFIEKSIMALNIMTIKEQLQPWKNRAQAIELINPKIWKTENSFKQDLVKKIIEYRKNHNYDSFKKPYFTKKEIKNYLSEKDPSLVSISNNTNTSSTHYHDTPYKELRINPDPLEKLSNWVTQEEIKFKAIKDDSEEK